MTGVAEAVSALPRRWWFCRAPGLERRNGIDGGTYWAYPLNEQPAVEPFGDGGLDWLSRQPLVEDWPLSAGDAQPQRRLTADELLTVADGAALPVALTILSGRPDLQQRLRSFTGCYFDLGDRAVAAEGGVRLLHFLSDQQWVRHWLVVIGATHERSSPVVTTQLPLGFDLGADDREVYGSIPEPVPLDGTIDLDVAADSLEHFLYRFWIENEIAFRVAERAELGEPFKSYALRLRRGE